MGLAGILYGIKKCLQSMGGFYSFYTALTSEVNHRLHDFCGNATIYMEINRGLTHLKLGLQLKLTRFEVEVVTHVRASWCLKRRLSKLLLFYAWSC